MQPKLQQTLKIMSEKKDTTSWESNGTYNAVFFMEGLACVFELQEYVMIILLILWTFPIQQADMFWVRRLGGMSRIKDRDSKEMNYIDFPK